MARIPMKHAHRPFRFAALALCAAIATVQAADPVPSGVQGTVRELAPATLKVDRVEAMGDSGQQFRIVGTADRNATVSDYLRALDGSGHFKRMELLQISVDADGRPRYEIMIEPKPTAMSGRTAPKKPTVYRCKIDGRDVFQSLPCPNTQR